MAQKNRRPDKPPKVSPKRAKRIAQALSLREAGATYEQIGEATGVSPGQAFRDVEAGLELTITEPAAALRAVEGRRLDRLQRAMLPAALQGDKGATDRVLKIMERRAKLYGLDTPVTVNVRDEGTSRVASMLGDLLADSLPAAEE